MTTTVLFAGVHNAGRSQMAAAFFNALAESDLARAISAGTKPADAIQAEVRRAMADVGIDLSDASPRFLSSELAARAGLLITMGCGETCPSIPRQEVRNWDIEDPSQRRAEAVRCVRDAIHVRVLELIEEHGWGRDDVRVTSRPPIR